MNLHIFWHGINLAFILWATTYILWSIRTKMFKSFQSRDKYLGCIFISNFNLPTWNLTFELIVTVQFGRPRNSKLRLYCNACNSHGKLCTCPKGQLISGGNFCFFKSPKKTFFLKIFTRFLGIPGEISFTSFDHTFEILPKCGFNNSWGKSPV